MSEEYLCTTNNDKPAWVFIEPEGKGDLVTQHIRARVQRGSIVIDPYSEGEEAFGLSFGLSSAGYDIRMGETKWLFPWWGRKSFALEFIKLPNDLRGRIENKSTNARLFIDASRTTNIEPGWEGHLTLELTRDVPWPVRLPKGYPIAQVIFVPLSAETERPYRGKYNRQGKHVVPAIAAPWWVRWGFVKG